MRFGPDNLSRELRKNRITNEKFAGDGKSAFGCTCLGSLGFLPDGSSQWSRKLADQKRGGVRHRPACLDPDGAEYSAR
jgi:hypothetical protein